MKKIRNSIIPFIVGVLTSAIVIFFSSEIFEIDKKIQILDIISLIIMTVLTYYIASVLDAKKEKNKIMKELYIRKIIEIEEKLDLLETKIQNRKCSFQEIISILSIVGKKQQSLFNSLKKYYNGKEMGNLEDKIKKLKENLRSSCTMTPIYKKNNKGNNVEIVAGEVKFGEKIASEIMNIIEDYKDMLFELQISVNNI